MKMLPIAITSLIVSLLLPCDSEAQFRYGGISINIPLGGYGYGGYGHGGYGYSHYGHGYGGHGYGGHGYGGRGYGGYGPHVGIPIYPTPAYRVPAYRVPIYRSYTPRVQSYSFRVAPSRRYVTPSRSYVYPHPPVDRLDENTTGNAAELGQVYGNYESARPVTPSNAPDYFGNGLNDDLIGNSGFGSTVIDANSLLQSAGVLRESLSRRSDDSDIWLDYLKPDLIIDTVQADGDGSTLQELLKSFDGLSGNADLSDLWVVPGFRRTHQGLRAYVEAAASRDLAQLESEPDAQPLTDSVSSPVADPSVSDPQPDADHELPSPL